jgi:hypothetical protein
MAQMLAGLADGAADAVFFDVHVEGVEHDLDPRVVDFLDKLDGFLGGVEEVALETVENLEAIVHATGLCNLAISATPSTLRDQSPGLSIGWA